MANSEINRKTLLTGIIDTNSKSEISIFQMYGSFSKTDDPVAAILSVCVDNSPS